MIEQINKTSLGNGVESDAVGAVDRKAQKQTQEDLAKAKIGPEALAGRRSDLAQIALNKLYGGNGKKEKDDFILKAAEVQRYLREVEGRIKRFEDLAKRLKKEAEEYDRDSGILFGLYERMYPIRDALKAKIDAGQPLTEAERQEAIQLVEEANEELNINEDVNPEIKDAELVSLLDGKTKQVHSEAINKHKLADAKNELSREVKELTGELEAVRDSDMSPEEKEAAYKKIFENEKSIELLDQAREAIDDPVMKDAIASIQDGMDTETTENHAATPEEAVTAVSEKIPGFDF